MVAGSRGVEKISEEIMAAVCRYECYCGKVYGVYVPYEKMLAPHLTEQAKRMDAEDRTNAWIQVAEYRVEEMGFEWRDGSKESNDECSQCGVWIDIDGIDLGSLPVMFDCGKSGKKVKTHWASYHEYLKSDEWKRKADKCRENADYRCQLCNGKGMLVAHHRTYDSIYREFDGDLTCLCESCHKKYHGLKD